MWCRANVAAGTWDQHGHSEGPKKALVMPAVSARFYFANATDAEAFRNLWGAEATLMAPSSTCNTRPGMSDNAREKLAACLNYSATPSGAGKHPYFDACAQWFNNLSPDDKETVLDVIDCVASSHSDIAESIAATLPPAPRCRL